MSKLSVILAIALGAAFAVCLLLREAGREPPRVAEEEPFRPERCMLPQEPVTEVPYRSVAEATDSPLPDELVLGVRVGDQARAYPIRLMNDPPERKVLNDTVGGRPILATW
jgi:hypothetical protein